MRRLKLTELDDDVLGCILELLPPEFIASKCSLVCRAFGDICKSEWLWERIVIRLSEGSVPQAEEIAEAGGFRAYYRDSFLLPSFDSSFCSSSGMLFKFSEKNRRVAKDQQDGYMVIARMSELIEKPTCFAIECITIGGSVRH